MLLLSSCGTSKKAGSDSEVNSFLSKFNKEKFITDIEEHKKIYEATVSKLKNSNKSTKAAKNAYIETQEAYNYVLDRMNLDIGAVNDIISFKLFNPDNRYGTMLADAKAKGDAFLLESGKATGAFEVGVTPTISLALSSIYPLIKKVHKRYLNYVKQKVQIKLNDTKLRSWDNI